MLVCNRHLEGSKGDINVIKYNYADYEKEKCRIWFNRLFTELKWRSERSWFTKSIKLNQIQGLLFGAFSSTFDKHRDRVLNYESFKEFTMKGTHALEKLRQSRRGDVHASLSLRPSLNDPLITEEEETNKQSPDDIFYSWECVSLVMKHRTYDFVIKDR